MWRLDEILANVHISVHITLSLLTLLLLSVTFGNVSMPKLNISSFFPPLLLFCHAFLTVVQVQGMCLEFFFVPPSVLLI